MESIIKQIENLGFDKVRVNSLYAPLKLECIAHSFKRIVGENGCGRKYFLDGEHYTLYCMYGRDSFDECHLFCNDSEIFPCYKIIEGWFLFVFNAEQFFQLLCNASRRNWRNFIEQTILLDPEELTKFKNLIENCPDLPDKRRNRGLALIKEPEKFFQ